MTTTVEGRERYPVNVRYLQGYRDNPSAIGRIPITGTNGQLVALSQPGDIRLTAGPSMLRNETPL